MKNLKKTERKLKRALYIVEKILGNISSNLPTKIVLVANGGLTSEVDNTILFKLFNPFGAIESIITPLDASFSFVVFQQVKSATDAILELNGEQCDINCNEQRTFYLTFANRVPDVVYNCFNCSPPGARIIEDFVSESEEAELLQQVQENLDSNNLQNLKHRQVTHYGYAFNYDTNSVDLNEPLERKIPENWLQIMRRLQMVEPNQLTVNRYQPGQGIPQHVDTHSAFEGPILSLSLGSQISMEFHEPVSGQHCSVFLPRRSLLIMDDESRYLWNHGITCRKNDVIRNDEGRLELKSRLVRTSFTFRKVNESKACLCGFPESCDYQRRMKTQTSNALLNVSEEQAKCLEAEHVHSVYDNIADHFSETRHKPWPQIARFLDELPIGSLLLDVGCGNGKYLGRNQLTFQLGCDMSANLLNICRHRDLEVAQADIMNLPFRSNTFDAALCIAVLHHLALPARRLNATKELFRILKPGGSLLLYVWSLEQEKERAPSKYIKSNRKQADDNSITVDVLSGVELPVHVNRTGFVQQDLLVPWKSEDSSSFNRFYHVFREGELESLLSAVKDIKITRSFYDQGNWGVEATKCL